MSAIGVAEPGQSLAASLRLQLLRCQVENHRAARLLDMAGEEARAEEYDNRARDDARRAARYAPIPAVKLVKP